MKHIPFAALPLAERTAVLKALERCGMAPRQVCISKLEPVASLDAEALPHLAAGVKLNPDQASAHFVYAMALQKTGHREESIAQFDAAARLARQQNNTSMLAEIERYLAMSTTTRSA